MDSQAVKVYVLELGEYGDGCIEGVYATPEAAMAAAHLPTRKASGPRTRIIHDVATGTTREHTEFAQPAWYWVKVGTVWHYCGHGRATITEYEVES